jgi:hypothetical protein
MLLLRLVIFAFINFLSIHVASGVPLPCDEKSIINHHPHFGMAVIDTNVHGQIHFFPTAEDAEGGKNPMKSFVIPGDLIFTQNIYAVTEANKGKRPQSICAAYRARNKKAVFVGWLQMKNLAELPGKFAEASEDLKNTLKKLPEIHWPTELWRDENSRFHLIFHTNKENSSELAIDTGIHGTEGIFYSLVAGPRTATYRGDSPKRDCPFTIYFLNNAAYLQSGADSRTSCYGNHGDSDPSGIYFQR